jgi:hypothetical protein
MMAMPTHPGRRPCVSGTVVRNNGAAFASLLGEDVVREAFAVDPRFAFWQEATGIEWIDAELVADSVLSLARTVGREAEALNAAATRLGTAQSFRTVWRVLLRFTSNEALIARSSVLYSRAFDTGRIEYEQASDGRGVLRLLDWTDPPRIHMIGLAAGIETMLRLSGRATATTLYRPRGREHLFEVSTAA